MVNRKVANTVKERGGECISLGGANCELGANPRDEWISVEMILTYSADSGLDDPPTLQIGDWVIHLLGGCASNDEHTSLEPSFPQGKQFSTLIVQ